MLLMFPRTFQFHSRWVRLLEVLLLLALFVLLARWATVLLAGTPLPAAPAISNPPAPRSMLAAEMMNSARLFGSHPAGSLSENVQVVGLIADTGRASAHADQGHDQSQSGSVLISVDGAPPKAYRIGSDVEGRRLVAIRPGEIDMEANGLRQTFRLPPSPVQAAPGIMLSSPR